MQGIPASKSPLAGLFFFSASEGPRALRADGAPCRKALGPGMRRAGAGEAPVGCLRCAAGACGGSVPGACIVPLPPGGLGKRRAGGRAKVQGRVPASLRLHGPAAWRAASWRARIGN